MLQLKELAGLQNQRQALDGKRQEQSSQFYQQGMQAFARASQSDFHDKAALQQALDAWMQAIRHQRNNPAPYIALSYLFSLLGDTRTAMMYAKAAQQQDSRHPDPPKLIEHLLARQSPSKPVRSGDAVQPQDDDQSLDYFEQLLATWLRRISSWPAPVPVLT